ncbi:MULTISPECIES: hypothetical protein [Streptomyces]|uniref:hypothetical protein n=1 Tax=Streptomyces TaxID=1883 RepID=UPI00131A30B7|nr:MULTISPECIES: hypothetical protein [Streptomyces]MYS94789.1 hypothetical protein [Streptomyces sp. SID5464]
MGNLGKYQDIVEAAKRAGGVDALIKIIQDAAVAKASPGVFRKGAALGAGAGVVGTLAAGGVAVTVRRSLDDKRAREALANEAEKQFKAEVEKSMNSDGDNPKSGEGDKDSDEV